MKEVVYVVVDTTDEQIVLDVQNSLSRLCICSFSPCRRQNSLEHSIEFYATIETDSLEKLVPRFNAYWTGSQEQWADYGYNTPMFHPYVYYLAIV